MSRPPANHQHLLSITLSLMWYVWFFLYIFKPQLIIQVFGSQSWAFYILALTFLALFSLTGFFIALLQLDQSKGWRRLIWLNGALVTVPLYFLWWTYLN